MITITEEILKNYYIFKENHDKSNCNFEILEGFFLNFQPFVVSISQLESIGYEKITILKLISDGKTFDRLNTKVISATNIDDIVKQTKLKTLLAEKNVSTSYNLVNILENRNIGKKFTGNYSAGENRYKAKKHIQFLIEDSIDISIYDKYMAKTNNFDINIKLLKAILPQNSNIKLFIENINTFDSLQNDLFKNELKKVRNDLTIEWDSINKNIHDRYIKNTNMKILLSSGLYYLEKDDKDFSYIIYPIS